jgi:hypothetical protein
MWWWSLLIFLCNSLDPFHLRFEVVLCEVRFIEAWRRRLSPITLLCT